MVISKDLIQELRAETGAGIMDCKEALLQTAGDLEKAKNVLRKKGLSIATKKASRETGQGKVASYVHLDGKVGVLIEVNCETDFVAKNEVFKEFVKDVTMQIAAQNPRYLSREDVPEEVIDRESQNFRSQEEFFKEVCLLEQPFIKNPEITIKEYLTSVIAKTRENIVIRRFTRYGLGEELE